MTRASQISFCKMHGAGNDFVMLDARAGLDFNPEIFAREVCKRHLSVGADGLILIENSKKADFRMLYFNADGSRSVCGNGMRCAGQFIKNLCLIPKDTKSLTLETDRDIVELEFVGEMIKVYMGRPEFEPKLVPIASSEQCIAQKLVVRDREFVISAVSMGNPHCVIIVDELSDDLVLNYGKALETHPFFPEKANVEFVVLDGKDRASLRIFERGVGETLACGTGICAVFAVLKKLGQANETMQIFARGGEFRVDWDEARSGIYLTGPTKTVFTGVLDSEFFS